MHEIENYRRVELQPVENLLSKRPLDGTIDEFLDSINSHFAENELRLFRNGNEKFELWLRELSIHRLEEVLKGLSANFSGDEKTIEGFCKSIQNTVENIGSYGIRGNKRLYVGYNKERKVADRKNKEVRRGKHYYANDHEFLKHNNTLPDEYQNKFVRGDSEAVLKQLPDNCIDLVFTSPPYNFGLDYETSNDTADWGAYFDKLFKILDECVRVLMLFSFRGDIVLDPFMGVGTTCISAINNHRKYLGIDISGEYCEIARQRKCSTTNRFSKLLESFV